MRIFLKICRNIIFRNILFWILRFFTSKKSCIDSVDSLLFCRNLWKRYKLCPIDRGCCIYILIFNGVHILEIIYWLYLVSIKCKNLFKPTEREGDFFLLDFCISFFEKEYKEYTKYEILKEWQGLGQKFICHLIKDYLI